MAAIQVVAGKTQGDTHDLSCPKNPRLGGGAILLPNFNFPKIILYILQKGMNWQLQAVA